MQNLKRLNRGPNDGESGEWRKVSRRQEEEEESEMKMSTRGQRNLYDVLILSSSFRMNTLRHYTTVQVTPTHPVNQHFKCTNGGNIDELLCKDESSSETGSGTKYYFREMNKYPRNVSVWRCACCGRCFPFSRLTTYLLSCFVSVSAPFPFSYFLYPGGYIREEKEVVSIQRNSLGERNGWMMMMMIHEQKLRSISCCGTFSGAVNPGVVGGGLCVKWSVTLGKFDSFFYSNKCWIFRIWILLNGEWFCWWMRNFYSISCLGFWITRLFRVIFGLSG